MKPIKVVEIADAAFAGSDDRDAVALRIDPSRRITLRFQLKIATSGDLEALRYARRAMIREERTRGLEWDEPSMEDPGFVGNGIGWFVVTSQGAWCRQKVSELIERTNRAREAMRSLGL